MKSILVMALAMLALPAQAGEGAVVTVYTTAQGAQRQMVDSRAAPLAEGHALNEGENSVFVDPARRFHQAGGSEGRGPGPIGDLGSCRAHDRPQPANRSAMRLMPSPRSSSPSANDRRA